MSEKFNEDDLSTYDDHENATKLPLGWLLLFVGLIAFGVYYIYSFTPQLSGWTQDQAYIESLDK